MKTAYSFIRFSKPQQAKGDSIRRQREGQAWAEKHGYTLVELEPMKGRSAWKGKQRATGPLADLVKLAEAGRLAKGSVLLVESLDRLTREQVRTAVKFFLSLLDLGITIVTTNPEYVYSPDGTRDTQDIIIAVVTLSRANEESERKSERCGAAWANLRTKLAETGGRITRTCPAWLTFDEDAQGFKIVKEAAKTVRKIFELATHGYGSMRIARQLNKDAVPTIGSKAKQWYETYIIAILNSRAVIGEFQPCRRVDGKRATAGDPVKDYYPSILTISEFVAARKAIDSRATGTVKKIGVGGRTGKNVPNIFGKLLKNPRDGGGFLYVGPKNKSPLARLEPVGGRVGACLPLAMRYSVVEDAFLKFLTEVKPEDLTGQKIETPADDLAAKLSDLTRRIEKLQATVDTTENYDFLVSTLRRWEGERKEVAERLEQLKHETPETSTLADAQDLVKLLATTEDKEDIRTRIKQAVRTIISEIWLLVYEYEAVGSRSRTRGKRAAVLQVHFKSGQFRKIMVNGDGRTVFTNRRAGRDIRQHDAKYDKPLSDAQCFQEWQDVVSAD